MQYVLLVYLDGERFAALPEATRQRIHDEAGAWQAGLDKDGLTRAQWGLRPSHTATTLSEKNGKLVISDGPFAETREMLGGFTVVECTDLDEALAITKRFTGLHYGLSVEVRPCFVGDPRNQP